MARSGVGALRAAARDRVRVWPFVAATVSWAKWALAFVVVLYVAIGVIGSLSMPWWLLEPDPDVDPDPMPDGEDQAETTADDRDRNIGFCLSGGGVRSASFALGMMQRFERWHGADATDLRRARRHASPPSPEARTWPTGSPWPARLAPRGATLPTRTPTCGTPLPPRSGTSSSTSATCSRGPTGPGATWPPYIVGLLVNTLLLVALVALVSVPIGRFVASDAVEPHAASPSSGLELGVQLWGPVVVWAAIGAFITVFSVLAGRLTAAQIPFVSRFGRFVSSRVAPIGFLLLGFSVFLAVILVALPVLMVKLPMLFHFLGGNESSQMVSVGGDAMPMTDVPSAGPRILQVLSSLGVVSAIVAIVQRGVSKNLVRLGGVFLALSAVLLGGEWATMAAQGGDTFPWTRYVIGVTVAVVVLGRRQPGVVVARTGLPGSAAPRLRHVAVVGPTPRRCATARPGTAGTEDEQLGAAFSYGNPSTDEVVAGVPDDPVNTRERPAEPSIYELAADGQPITEFCATMNVTRSGAKPRSGNRPLPEPSHQAVPQTHPRDPGVQHDVRVPPGSYFVPYNDGSFGEVSCRPDQLEALGFRWDGTRLTPTTCSGMLGAAVAPSMGRASVGSSGALLAFANIRLGVWQPNPRYVSVTVPADAPPMRPAKPYWFPRVSPHPPHLPHQGAARLARSGRSVRVRHRRRPLGEPRPGGDGARRSDRPLPKELVCADASGVSIDRCSRWPKRSVWPSSSAPPTSGSDRTRPGQGRHQHRLGTPSAA